MERKTFIRQSGLLVLGLAAYGNISWRDGRYVGDSMTTSDILGPFYRPGAPLRSNLTP
jgi:catechol 1,2-dioxygenase